MSKAVEPVAKDAEAQRPVASAWRGTLSKIVEAFAQGDYSLSRPSISGVSSLRQDEAKRIEEYIAQYGETLIALPEDAWRTSVSQWMDDYWEVLVDLYTQQSGASDLVMSVRVFEFEDGYRFKVDSVHVP